MTLVDELLDEECIGTHPELTLETADDERELGAVDIPDEWRGAVDTPDEWRGGGVGGNFVEECFAGRLVGVMQGGRGSGAHGCEDDEFDEFDECAEGNGLCIVFINRSILMTLTVVVVFLDLVLTSQTLSLTRVLFEDRVDVVCAFVVVPSIAFAVVEGDEDFGIVIIDLTNISISQPLLTLHRDSP